MKSALQASRSVDAIPSASILGCSRIDGRKDKLSRRLFASNFGKKTDVMLTRRWQPSHRVAQSKDAQAAV
jgi:hypothetical protein